MKKISKLLLNCGSTLCGIILLILVIMFWATLFVLTSLVSIVELIESKLANLMKKCIGEEL